MSGRVVATLLRSLADDNVAMGSMGRELARLRYAIAKAHDASTEPDVKALLAAALEPQKEQT